MPTVFTRRRFLGASAGLATTARAAFALPQDLRPQAFHFIQVTDTHISAGPLVNTRQGYSVTSEESVRRGRAVVADINNCAYPHDLIVHTGDVAHTRDNDFADFDLAREILQFKKPAYFVPGNHDVGYSQTGLFRPHFEKRWGEVNRAFEPVKGLRFVLFDSQPLDPRAPDEDRERAFQRLEAMLTPAKPSVVFCHVTGIDPFYINRLHEGWPAPLMTRWTETLKKGGVIGVLGGHEHRDEHYRINGVSFHIAGPVINFWGRQTGYRIWGIEDGMLAYRSVYLEL